MINKIINSLFAIFYCGILCAQTPYTIDMSSGTLELDQLHDVEIITHDNNNIEIHTRGDRISNKKADGLRILSPSGLQDNTGINLFQEKTSDGIRLMQVASNLDVQYTIRVPKNLNIRYSQSGHQGDDLVVRGISGELEATSGFSDVILEDVSGPCAINTLHGDIKAHFNNIPSEGSISLHSAHGDVDVTIPGNAKLDLTIRSGFGTIFTDLDLTVNGSDDRHHGSNNRWTYNGGGFPMHLETSHSNVYLRKSN